MKPIQVVLDDALLQQLDRAARHRKLSRSAFLRQALAETLERLRIAEQVAQVHAAYAKVPETREERATAAAMRRSQARAVAAGDDW